MDKSGWIVQNRTYTICLCHSEILTNQLAVREPDNPKYQSAHVHILHSHMYALYCRWRLNTVPLSHLFNTWDWTLSMLHSEHISFPNWVSLAAEKLHLWFHSSHTGMLNKYHLSLHSWNEECLFKVSRGIRLLWGLVEGRCGCKRFHLWHKSVGLVCFHCRSLNKLRSKLLTLNCCGNVPLST